MKTPKYPNTQVPKFKFLRCGGSQYPLGVWVFGSLGISLLLTGCCRDRGVELIDVSGYVTLDGHPPPGGGTIYFNPYESLGGEPLRPSSAYFGDDGFFQAAAFHDDTGLIPGKYHVGIHCWEVEPTIDGPPARSFVPQRYMHSATSGLELVLEPGSSSVSWNAELTSD